MTRREQYQLFFQKIKDGKSVYFFCRAEAPNHEYAPMASKLSLMSTGECEGLIESIDDAQNGIYYEEYYALDADSASDDDEIHISPPNIIIDKIITVPFQDMKELLQEWIDFQSS